MRTIQKKIRARNQESVPMDGKMLDYSGALTPAALVAKFSEAGISISERTLRERARQLGAYRLIGKTMFFLPEDIALILERSKPQPKKPAAATSKWTDDDTEALIERLTPKSKRKPRRRLCEGS